MDAPDDGAQVAASLATWLDRLTFMDLSADEVTVRVIEAVVDWAGAQGWRVYRRAPSVLPLPPPLQRQRSVLDVACARPAGRPVAVEVDQTDRRRTVDKLVAEAGAGRIPLWVRWGAGPINIPTSPVHLVRCEVLRTNGPVGRGRLYTRLPVDDRPPPRHSRQGVAGGTTEVLPLDFVDPPPA